MPGYSRRWNPDDPASYIERDVPRLLMLAALRQYHMAPWERYRDRAIIAALFYTGLRASEVTWLEVSCVYLEAHRLRVVRQKGSQRKKNPKPPSILYFGDTMCTALEEYLPLQAERWGNDWPFLFPSRRGGPLGRQAVWSTVKRLARFAELPADHLFPHAFRHALAQALFESGVEAPAVQQALRHENLATTSVYSSAVSRRRRELAAAALDSLDKESL